MKLTDRIVASVALIVIAAIFILFIGGAVSFRKLGNDFLVHYLNRVVEQIDQAGVSPQNAQYIEFWLPKMLQASDVVELEVRSKSGLLYQYQQITNVTNYAALMNHRFDLPSNPGFFVTIKSRPPYADFTYSIHAMSSLGLAILVILLGLILGIRWLKIQLRGADILSHRSRLILAGRRDEALTGMQGEWPQEASAAFNTLLLELKDARQERCRFDTFLRSNMFLDKLTGVANRLMFDNRLQTKLHDQGSYGAVMLLEIHDWEHLKQCYLEDELNEWLMQIASLLSTFSLRYSDVVLARYYENQFAFLLFHHTTKSAKQFANQLMKMLQKQTPLPECSMENWTSLGVTFFSGAEKREQLMQEAELAKRSAKQIEANAWHAYEKNRVVEDMRGSVRWRTLFERVFAQNNLYLYPQSVLDCREQVLHFELIARIKDEKGKLLKASSFMKGIHLVGMNQPFDRAVLLKAVNEIVQDHSEQMYSVNLCCESLMQKTFRTWLRDTLFQMPKSIRQRLFIELTESSLVQYFSEIRSVLHLLKSLGVEVIVDQAGRTIVSTHYIKDVQPKYIKLHHSLVQDIHHRPENQLFIRSMLGACQSTAVQVLAVGIETSMEWLTLIDIGVKGGQGRLFCADYIEQPIKKKRRRWK